MKTTAIFFLLTQRGPFFPRRLSSTLMWLKSHPRGPLEPFTVTVFQLRLMLMCSGMAPKVVFILRVYTAKSSMLFWFWSFPQLHFTKYHFCGDISPPLCLGLTLLILGKGTMGQRNQLFLDCLLLILMESHFVLFELSSLCGTGHSPYRCCVGWFWGECCVLFAPLCHWISTSLLESLGEVPRTNLDHESLVFLYFLLWTLVTKCREKAHSAPWHRCTHCNRWLAFYYNYWRFSKKRELYRIWCSIKVF